MNDTLTDNPTVSIVMPTYNRAYCIEKTIQSVLNQTFEDWELIIVDNNSTDNSIEIIQNIDDDRISIYQVNNKGIIAKSRNLGIYHSNGTYIAFLDSDDLWTLDKLEKSLSTLQLGYDIVYHDLFIISKLPPVNNIFNMLSTRNLHQPVFNDLLLNGNALNNSSVVVRKELIKDIHGFSEEKELVGSEDNVCWIRLSKNTNRFCRIDFYI